MVNQSKSLELEVHLKEYEKLKDEQIARIGFRDNLLYATLVVFCGVVSIAISGKTPNYNVLLVIPWASLILGWTYLVNDDKVSALGRYIRLTLVRQVNEKVGSDRTDELFAWEIAHRSDARRKRRKIEQLLIDEITFAFSGLGTLAAYWILEPAPHWEVQVLFWGEVFLLIVLGIEILLYADLGTGR